MNWSFRYTENEAVREKAASSLFLPTEVAVSEQPCVEDRQPGSPWWALRENSEVIIDRPQSREELGQMGWGELSWWPGKRALEINPLPFSKIPAEDDPWHQGRKTRRKFLSLLFSLKSSFFRLTWAFASHSHLLAFNADLWCTVVKKTVCKPSLLILKGFLLDLILNWLSF